LTYFGCLNCLQIPHLLRHQVHWTQMLAKLRDAGVYVDSIDFASEGGEQVVLYYRNPGEASRERLMEIVSSQDEIASVKITP